MVLGTCCFLFMLNSHIGLAQTLETQVQLSFSNQLKNPIEIQVEDNDGKITFVAINNSYYPYTVIIEFKRFINLSPQDRFLKSVAYKGRTILRNYTILDPTVAHDYIYNVTYFIGDVYAKVNKDFLYTVPFKSKQTIQVTDNVHLGKLSDTICAIRKGVITAVSHDGEPYDRITKNSIEVLHKDGTVAIYTNVRLMDDLARGQVVLPGQPIGILGAPFLKMELLHIRDQGILNEEAIKYSLDGKLALSVAQLNQQVALHPASVVEREMTKTEKRTSQKKTSN